MANKQHTEDWQNAIAQICAKRLQRSLTQEEMAFIKSQIGFMALEGIEDSVRTLSLDALEELLNSRND